MDQPIIEVNNLSKRYYLGREGYITLRDSMAFAIRSPFKFAKSKFLPSARLNEFWALKDLNFKVQAGETLGIIGRNGAGKSTLLKILSRITPPTTGEVRLRGRVGSLLEVGTGFHPELSGRENIFLNGAILGMRSTEIKQKLDQIIDFSGVEKFIDMPVKRYSSGMYVRLAFSVAAHLEPDILIVDEVLSVGDAEFQKKCLGKMGEVTKQDGRTVLFVSHNMSAVEDICAKTILLEKGRVKAYGKTAEIVDQYLNDVNAVKESQVQITPDPNKDITFTKIWVTDSRGAITNSVNVDDDFKIWLEFDVNKPTEAAEISICLQNSSGVNVVFTSLSDSFGKKFYKLERGSYKTSAHIRGSLLMPDNYAIRIAAHIRGSRDIDVYQDILRLIVAETGHSTMAAYGPVARYWSAVLSGAEWQIQENN